MSFLRLGVCCAVINAEGALLLSQRGDFDVWNLPTGRVDAGETLAQAALRETEEETGIRAEIVRPAGLYYQAGRGRMNVLYAARPLGGELLQKTEETRANRYFAPDALPDKLFGDFMAYHALSGGLHLHTLETPPEVLRRIKRKLALRWVMNLLRGQPEPRWPRFTVTAALLAEGPSEWTSYQHQPEAVQRVTLDGEQAPWDALGGASRWVGLWQAPEQGRYEFVFTMDNQEKGRV